ncbi:hypothetical protein [Siphonobacter sp. SORGH_AS_0500]|uniref:hypothetical protein n=1 Tax=Siphonobacter sp. SORGH_AS_0500 TaxID=1864824 RepID=UPI00285A4719|nr:hypothetical protein [Siphonobacter sp. SORGH_AS_0500]MDR6196689.1 DNA-binding CsgD family transcriptional regulator [Siphonobacter sp. SORGH_AS_0500]
MKYTLYLVLFLVFSSRLKAQNRYLDSLNSIVSQKSTDTRGQLKTLPLLVEFYRNEDLYNKALGMNSRLIALAKKENNELGLVKAYANQGLIYNNKEDFQTDRKYLDSVRTIANQSKIEITTAYANYLEAYILNSYEDYRSAVKTFQKVLKIIEHSDEEFLKAKVNYMLYTIYSNWNDVENTLLYARKAVEAAEKSGDKNLLSNTYSALAVAYTYLYDTHKKKSDLDRLFEICNKAIALHTTYPGQVTSRTYAIAKLNVVSYYLKYYPGKNTFTMQKTMETLEVAKNAPGNELIIASCYGILGTIAEKQNNNTAAMQYLQKARDIVLKTKPVYYYTLIQACEGLASLYRKTGQYEQAYLLQKEASEYYMKLFDEEQATTTKKLQAQYESEKKERELTSLKDRAESQRVQKLLYAGLGIITLLGAFYMFRSYHFKLKYSIHREKELSAAKNEAELQALLEKEAQYRLKAEQELLSLQQEKLQNEILASQLHLQHKNEVLQQLKDKLREDAPINIHQIIREENLLDNDFEKAKFQIQKIHPNFFKTLSDNARQKLTPLDLKYCAYFYLGIDTKQIANLLSVEPKSVRMTRYRLKQKFGLDTETDLITYLKKLG